MKISIIGFENTGKKTIFELLTGRNVDTAKYKSEKQLISANAEALDARFDRLAEIYKPKKKVRALIEFQLLQPFEKSQTADKEIFRHLKNADAVCFVAREFKDDSVYHIDGSISAARDIEWFIAETILNDLVLLEVRIKNIEEDLKKKLSREKETEKKLLIKLKEHLEGGCPLRTLAFAEDEEKILSAYQFLTDKCLIGAVNVSEEDIKNETVIKKLEEKFKGQNMVFQAVSAKLEKELSLLAGDERRQFLEEYGIKQSSLSALTGLSYKALGLMTFFTASEDEVRSWMTKKNSKAPQAARAIHKDMEKGFIRAEVMKFSDIDALGSEKKVKEAGKFYTKGADYIVEDGDILHILFNI